MDMFLAGSLICLTDIACMLQVHGKRFAVLMRFIDEIEASLNPEEAKTVDHKADLAELSDHDSSEHSMQ